MKKCIVLSVAVLIAGLIGWQIYQKAFSSSGGPGRDQKSAAVAVEIRPVETASIRDIRSFTGTLQPISQFVVAPKIAGRLDKVRFNIGDKLRNGQLVAVLDDEEYLRQVDQSKAELEVASANLEESRNTLEVSKREFDRTQALREKKIASESELDAAESGYKTQEAKLKVAMAQVVQKEAVLKMAKVRLSYTQIRLAWENGNGYRVVGERFADEGAMLAANTPIVSILDIGTMIAVIHVIERDYAGIRIGMEAVVATDAFPGKTFTGRIVRIAPLLKEASRQAKIEIEIPNKNELLKPGMFVRVRIEFDSRDQATVVPLSALLKRNGQQGVFMANVEEKTARFIPVTVGIINGNLAEIVNPSLSGAVVTLGHHLLEDGASIIPTTGEKSKSASPDTGVAEENIPKKGMKPRSGEKS